MNKEKVDRAFRLAVIDWLQYGEEFDEDRAQNTLTFIHELESQLKEMDKVVEAAKRLDADIAEFGTDPYAICESAQRLSDALSQLAQAKESK